MAKTKITHNFSLEEFACRDGEAYPSGWVTDRLRPLCLDLEIIRESLSGPIYITSGYRTPDYNAAIGGARFSQHIQGRAADIYLPEVPAYRVQKIVRGLLQRDELHHIKGLGYYPSFTHVDIRPSPRLVVWNGSRIIS